MAKYRPPMWSSKIYGEPHGLWEPEIGEAEMRPLDVRTASAGCGTL